MAAVDWANLPWPALSLISDFLPRPIDCTRFRSVCSSWRSAVPRRPHFPLLAGHRPVDDKTNTVVDFYRFTGSHIVPVNDDRLPETHLRGLCCGASHGWMAFLDPAPSFSLWNPVTKSRIQLPVLPTDIPDIRDGVEAHIRISKVGDEFVFRVGEEEGRTFGFWRSLEYLGSKLILSSDPTSDPNCIALLLCYRWKKVVFCKLGDNSWTIPLLFERLDNVNTDALFYRGRFHILCRHDLYILNLWVEPELERIHMAEPRLDQPSKLRELDEGYLVECDGELLVVYLFYSRVPSYSSLYVVVTDCGYELIMYYSFEVYKVSWGLHGAKLLRLRSLGDHALFLGRNQSFSLPASKVPGCRADCIYMAEYYKQRHDIRVYNLAACTDDLEEDNTNEWIKNCSNDLSPDWFPCAWVMPSSL